MEIDILLRYKDFAPSREVITESGKEQLLEVYEMCSEREWNFHNLKPLLVKMIQYDVSPSWKERIEKSKTLFKNDSSSKESFQNRYGEETGYRLWIEKTAKTTVTKDKYVNKYGKEAWDILCASKASTDEASFIRRYGEEEGRVKRQEYIEKWTKSVNAKGGWDNGLSLKSFIERHGKEKGYEMWDTRRKNQRKRFSKEWFRKEYGDEWKTKWNEYCAHMATLSSSAFNTPRKATSGRNGKTYSNISQCLFDHLCRTGHFSLDDVRYATNGGEVKFNFAEYKARGGGHWFAVDFVKGNRVIEFDGTYWHSLERVKEKDALKDEILAENGYKVLRIPEQEYNDHPMMVIEKCINFLNKEEKC